MTKKNIFFLSRCLAATKKLGTHTILMIKKTVGQMTIIRKTKFRSNNHISKKIFGQMTFRSNDLSVKWPFLEKAFDQINFRSNEFLRNFFRSNELFCQKYIQWNDHFLKNKLFIWPFGKNNFRLNGVWLNGDSVKWTFGQMAFSQTVFGQMMFRSNGLSVKKCSFKLCFGQKTFGQIEIRWNFFRKVSKRLFKPSPDIFPQNTIVHR
jgi:hypothetical protein